MLGWKEVATKNNKKNIFYVFPRKPSKRKQSAEFFQALKILHVEKLPLK